ncbi:MAG: helix-turn-helix domain-containing protein [Rhodoferax sp.]
MKQARQYQQLDYQERQTIAIGREQGLSIRAIARILNRAPSTISREIERNCGGATYACRFAQQRCARRRRMGRPGHKLVAGNMLFETVKALLKRGWSPQHEVAPFSRTPYRYGRRSPKCPKPSHRIRCNFDSKSSNWREQAERQRSYRVNSGHRPKALPTG